MEEYVTIFQRITGISHQIMKCESIGIGTLILISIIALVIVGLLLLRVLKIKFSAVDTVIYVSSILVGMYFFNISDKNSVNVLLYALIILMPLVRIDIKNKNAKVITAIALAILLAIALFTMQNVSMGKAFEIGIVSKSVWSRLSLLIYLFVIAGITLLLGNINIAFGFTAVACCILNVINMLERSRNEFDNILFLIDISSLNPTL